MFTLGFSHLRTALLDGGVIKAAIKSWSDTMAWRKQQCGVVSKKGAVGSDNLGVVFDRRHPFLGWKGRSFSLLPQTYASARHEPKPKLSCRTPASSVPAYGMLESVEPVTSASGI